tara:strand:+ start:911 stop:1192 length:282 start_codon:yes stop_codon:yes gene_type:complete
MKTANVTNIDTIQNTKRATVRVDLEALIVAWQKSNSLDECREKLADDFPGVTNKDLSTQAASLRKNGVPLKTFRRAKMDYSALAELAKGLLAE